MKSSIFTKKLNSYHQSRWRRIHQYIHAYLEKNDNNTLHDLRVEIKMLMALVNFIAFYDETFNYNKLTKPIKEIFKTLGNQRDYYQSVKFCKELKIKKSMLKNKWCSSSKIKIALNKYLKLVDELKVEIRERIKFIRANDIKKYLKTCTEDIDAALSNQKLKTNLHAVRKKMKDVIYLSVLASSQKSKFVSSEKLNILDETQDVIGKLHDITIFYSNLKKNSHFR